MAFLAGAEKAARQPKQATFHCKHFGGCFGISQAIRQAQIGEVGAESINAPSV